MPRDGVGMVCEGKRLARYGRRGGEMAGPDCRWSCPAYGN